MVKRGVLHLGQWGRHQGSPYMGIKGSSTVFSESEWCQNSDLTVMSQWHHERDGQDLHVLRVNNDLRSQLKYAWHATTKHHSPIIQSLFSVWIQVQTTLITSLRTSCSLCASFCRFPLFEPSLSSGTVWLHISPRLWLLSCCIAAKQEKRTIHLYPTLDGLWKNREESWPCEPNYYSVLLK